MTGRHDILYVDNWDQYGHIFNAQTNSRELDALSLIRINLVSLHYKQVGPEWGSAGEKRTSHYHHIHFVIDGEAKVFHEGQSLTLRKGHMYWLPANCPLECLCEKFYEQFFLIFQVEWANGCELFIRGRRPLCLGRWKPRDYEGQWRQSPLSLNAYWRLQALVQKRFAETLDNLDEIIREQHAYQAHFSRVFRFIDSRPINRIKVADLARMHGVSFNTFSRNFSRCFGVSPRKYLARRLNQQVIDLLVGTDLPMSKIAEELEFGDEYYFNRFFSAINGISPLRYRKQFSARRFSPNGGVLIKSGK